MVAATVPTTANPRSGFKESNVGVTAMTLPHAWVTAETDDVGDIVEFGYLPGGVTVFAVLNKAPDLDTNATPLITQTLDIGGTAVFTADGLCKTGGSEIYGIVPLVLTAPTLVKMTIAAAAATHANGTQYLTFFYRSTSS